jgi:hypothetical protein
VPVNEMPHRLYLKKSFLSNIQKRYLESRDSQPYFIRVSAINAELGEGPYSQIVELKKLQKRKLI